MNGLTQMRRAFTLVELLVVIAIISTLAALLLPTLDEGIESAHRTACANNNRQLYMAWSLYLDDYDSRFPGWQSQAISISNDHSTGQHNGWETNSALRIFYRNYAGVAVGLIKGNVPKDTNSIIFCPSRHSVSTAFTSYPCKALAAYTPDQGVGSPLITRMAQGYQGKPVVMLHERLWSSVLNPMMTGEGPHRSAGGHVVFADGKLRWYDISFYKCDNYWITLVQPIYVQSAYWNSPSYFKVLYNQQWPSTYTGDDAISWRRKVWGYRG